MKRIKVAEASGPALDWLVAKCEGAEVKYDRNPFGYIAQIKGPGSYSTNWILAGPIIERELLELHTWKNGGEREWHAVRYKDGETTLCREFEAVGPTPLVAAMRCYVASKLGDEAEVPEELT